MEKELIENARSNIYPFHMPGHKRRRMDQINPYDIDITEIESFDNLHHAEGIIKIAQTEAAELYEADHSYFLINGSTCGILAAISAATDRGDKILVARNCHKAVYHGIYLRQLKPVYIYPDITRAGIQGQIRPDEIDKALNQDPDIKAVFITSPTYDGVVSDIETISEIVHKRKIPLIVDEAHGAHFHFSNYFPTSAAELGADLVIQSFHKTLPSMTQTAVLHNCSDRVDSRLIRRFMGIYQSSSPSYILMASMDACMEKMSSDGNEMFREFTKILEKTRRRLSECKYIRLVSPEIGTAGVFDYDRSKLLFSTRYASMTGSELAQILLEKYHIQVEMETEHYVLALAAVGDSEEGFERLCQAIEEIDQEEAQKKKEKREAEEPKAGRTAYTSLSQFMSITEAMESESEIRKLEESVGRISAEFGYLYPPGIPLIVPGEQITGQFIRNMRIYMEEGLYLQGLEDYTNETIRVVAQNTTKEQEI